MNQTRRAHMKMLGAGLGMTILPAPLRASGDMAPVTPVIHVVEMRNRHPENGGMRNVFVPDLLRVKPGDTIRFVTVDKGHNTVSDDRMIPEGGQSWDGRIAQDVEVTLTTEGAYGYYCAPHRSLGMVGLILVGDVSGNYRAVKEQRQRGKAREVYADIFKRADALLAADA
ncbi:plastocyanin/azurin family copper-binding protein [Aliiroseovarius sp.]|uniref:plastocyanin/azurin family copper-binding protein n=1 Tax=Aliiroseovarius sp. TaxID=1872442 RepID=UPI00262FB0E8|nr:plastocyanin/azurin family copper-binding protein [Aliiroseovarius sp.]